MARKPAIVAYDISADSTRRQVYKILLEWRLDGQKSVHECVLSPAEAQELFMQLGGAIDPETDRLLLAWVAPYRAPQARGTGRVDRLFADLLNLR
jgi:CRISPR-associated protein Cas2